MTCGDWWYDKQGEFLFCAAIGICHWLPKKKKCQERSQSQSRRAIISPCQTKSIGQKRESQRPAMLLGFVSVLEHHKPVTTLFLRSADLGVERFCFLRITKIK